MKQDRSDIWQAVSVAATAGITMVVCIGLGLFLGSWVDVWLDSSPWCLLIGGLWGGITGLWSVIKQAAGRR
ncbi:AtpZ/AtpI family protein [Veillonella magna]|uniref:AtpZ/AtpI family protein n=1 Tax=Veillonella magna TaxID=464322 RepID=UPI0026651B1F|nr:AtpZ/AtpI family protein [Veillonella magna]